MDRLINHHALVSQQLYRFARAEDKLDQSLLMSLFIPDRTFTFDMSSHLGSAPAEVTPSAFYDQLVLTLSGFTATQHLLTNPIIEFKDDGPSKAHAIVNVCAYHALELDGKLESVTARGEIQADLEMFNGNWVFRRIVIVGTVPMDNPQLYQVAMERAQKGEGRKGC